MPAASKRLMAACGYQSKVFGTKGHFKTVSVSGPLAAITMPKAFGAYGTSSGIWPLAALQKQKAFGASDLYRKVSEKLYISIHRTRNRFKLHRFC